MTTTKNSTSIKRMVIAALMLALAYILPNFTGNIPQIGNMLLPMHLPTILCGYLCGGPWGAAVGFIAPLMRSAILGLRLCVRLPVPASAQDSGRHLCLSHLRHAYRPGSLGRGPAHPAHLQRYGISLLRLCRRCLYQRHPRHHPPTGGHPHHRSGPSASQSDPPRGLSHV